MASFVDVMKPHPRQGRDGLHPQKHCHGLLSKCHRSLPNIHTFTHRVLWLGLLNNSVFYEIKYWTTKEKLLQGKSPSASVCGQMEGDRSLMGLWMINCNQYTRKLSKLRASSILISQGFFFFGFLFCTHHKPKEGHIKF